MWTRARSALPHRVDGVAIEPLPGERNTVHTLSGSLEHLQRTLGLARPDTVRILTEAWTQLVGSRLSGVCRVQSIRGSELVVEVDDPAVAEHLRWQARDLAAAANDLCGCDAVDEVRIVVARRDRQG